MNFNVKRACIFYLILVSVQSSLTLSVKNRQHGERGVLFNGQNLLKLVSAIFYQIFIYHQMLAMIARYFSPNNSPSKSEKCFIFHLKSAFRSRDIQIFVIFPLSSHTLQIQKDKWKWNHL